MTHDYKRDGTTTLFASMNILDGTVIGRCMSQHRHQEFVRFLNAVERAVPAGKVIHAILDNYGAHKHPHVVKRLAGGGEDFRSQPLALPRRPLAREVGAGRGARRASRAALRAATARPAMP